MRRDEVAHPLRQRGLPHYAQAGKLLTQRDSCAEPGWDVPGRDRRVAGVTKGYCAIWRRVPAGLLAIGKNGSCSAYSMTARGSAVTWARDVTTRCTSSLASAPWPSASSSPDPLSKR